MTEASSLFIRLEYRLAQQLFHTRWLPRSPRTQRLTMHLFQRCADAGHPAALSQYGHMLFHRGVTPQDKARGARYVLEAAHAGDAKAQYQAGQIREHGCAQYPRRDDHAVTWYARAGEAGHPLAASRLARAYRSGELGLPMDLEKAEHWQALADRVAGLAGSLASGPRVADSLSSGSLGSGAMGSGAMGSGSLGSGPMDKAEGETRH